MKNFHSIFVIALMIVSFQSFVKIFAGPNDEIAGTWLGKLKVPGQELRIVFNIKERENGILTATMDSPDQGAKGLKVDTVIFDGRNIKLEVKAARGYFEGTFNHDSLTITGNWHQFGSSFPVLLKKTNNIEALKVPMPSSLKKIGNDKIIGIWLGKISFSGVELRIAFNIKLEGKGMLTGTMDSPDRGIKDIPIDTVIFNDGEINLEVRRGLAYFDGKVNPDSLTISGNWHQSGLSFPLILKRVNKIEEAKRSQEPKPPFPYKVEDISFKNKSAGVTLSGTLTIPKTGSSFPAVLLINGSGPENRDEEILGHKPFLVIADYLTRRGIAVLRYDKRGVGKSTRISSIPTSEDYAEDALDGVKYLKSIKEINPEEIGLIGHSEGGIIAPMVAVKSKDVAFIVLLAGPGIPGDQLLLKQEALIYKLNGIPEQTIKKDTSINSRIFEVIKANKDEEETNKEVNKIIDKFYSNTQKKPNLKSLTNPWMEFYIRYDPAPTLEKVKCPVLALNGSKDMQVPPEENLAAIKSALEKGGNKNFEVKELSGLNHLFQTAKTGAPAEYGQIEETFSPKALKIIGDWILKTVRKGKE